MTTLHIEAAITDLDTWRVGFDRFETARTQGGVRRYQIQQPIGDPQHIIIDFTFDTPADAQKFLDFLEQTVWTNRANAPALVGRPQVRLFEPVATG